MPKNNYDDDDDDLLMALQSMEPCGNCGAEGAKIPCMSGCGEVFYCSRECNMHHASAHRLRCRNLRCSKFNDSESESDSDDYEEFTDDSDAEYETDSGDDDDDEEEEEEEEVKTKKKGKKGKKRTKSRRTNSSRSVESGGSSLSRKVSVDADLEKRIEEKILKRLKKQEEQRIAMAIEQRMREEKANWRDDEMNRIIMEMRERFQSEMSNSAFFATLAKKNGLAVDSQEMLALQQSMEHSFLNANPQAEDKSAVGAAAVAGQDGEGRARSVSKESSWNNACRGFEALRVVVWKHSFLPRIKFQRDDASGVWNVVTEVDADESFAHILVGDKLLSVNGRAIDDACQTEDDINDVFAAYASPLIMKFEAADPSNGKVHDYTVTWTNGPLGVTLKDDCTTQKIPIVNRLTKKAGSVAVKQNIAIGDVLVAINNIDTIQLGCSLSMSILKKVQLPAKLRFRGVGGPAPGTELPSIGSQSSLTGGDDGAYKSVEIERSPSSNPYSSSMTRPSSYNINWAEGPLGLTIIPGINEGDMPVIKKVTGTGSSVGIEKAQVGDFLESMNDQQAAHMHFEDVVSYLKSAPKPVLLRFRAATGDEQPSPPTTAHKALSIKSMSSTSNSSNYAPESRASYDSGASRSLARTSSADSENFSRTMPTSSSSRGGSVIQISRDERSDIYRVVWGSGPLGLTIDANSGAPGAFIKRISSQGAAAHLSQDCIGDDLTHINDMDVSRVMFQDIVGHLKNVPRPVTLMFKRRNMSARHGSYSSTSSRMSEPQAPAQSSSRGGSGAPPVHYYNIVWQDGIGLGLSLRGADGTSEYPYITRVTGTGSAAHLPQTVINDCLISVDGRSVHVRDKSFDEVMTMLKVMQKPLTLKFQSRSENGPPPDMPPPPQQYSSPAQSSHMAPPPGPAGYASPSPSQPLPGPRTPNLPGARSPALPGPRTPNMPGARAPVKAQESYTWRQNRAAAPQQPQQQLSQSYSNVPSSTPPMQSQGSSAALSRSYAPGGSDRGLAAGPAASDEKFNSIQAPFLAPNKLSTGRRQKMLKGLRK